MGVKVIPVTREALSSELVSFEEKYGWPSEKLLEAFRNGQIKEDDDFQRWSSAYTAFLLTEPHPSF